MDDEDDKRLPSIDEEFAELDVELKRIAAMPVITAEQQNAVLMAVESLRAQYLGQLELPADAPPWRHAVNAAIAKAFDSLIADLKKGVGGEFNLNNELVKRHLEPVFQALADGLRQNLVDKFGKKPPPGAPPIKIDGADLAGILVTLFGPPPKKK